MLHTSNRYVSGLILDSLRYWASEMRVDGFRFDLASLFTRRSDGSIDLEGPPIIAAIQSDPVLSKCRLIAEAWDMSSYQLGRTFPGVELARSGTASSATDRAVRARRRRARSAT